MRTDDPKKRRKRERREYKEWVREGRDLQLRDDAEARAELIRQGVAPSTALNLYPAHKRVARYLRDNCDLEPGYGALPTDDPEYWVMTEPCDSTCHHPIHAFNGSRRVAHQIEVPPFD